MEINKNVTIEELRNATNEIMQIINRSIISDVSYMQFITYDGFNFKGEINFEMLSYDDDLRDRDCFIANRDFVIKSLLCEKYYDVVNSQTLLFKCAPVQIRKGDIIIITNCVTSKHPTSFKGHFKISIFRQAEFIDSYDIIRGFRLQWRRGLPDLIAVIIVDDEDTIITKLKNKIEEENNIAECAICVEEKKTINLKCQGKHDHTYCFDCFKKWYIDQNHKSCVLCFTDFDAKNI